jgi:hypothetical protein
MDWYRRYHGTCRDEKLELAANEADLPRPYAIAGWDGILEFASQHDARGSIEGMDARRLAVMIGCRIDEAERLISAFRTQGMIDGSSVVKWKDRQFQSDTSTERSRRHREKTKTIAVETDATLQQRSRNAPDTESDTDSERKKEDAAPPRRPPVDDDTKAATDPLGYCFRRFVEMGVARSLVGKWKLKLTDPPSDFLDILTAMEEANPDDPKSWFIAACQTRSATKKPRYGIPENSIFQF